MNQIDETTSKNNFSQNQLGLNKVDIKLKKIPADKTGLAFTSKSYQNIDIPEQVFINKEFFNKFFVSKVKEDYNVVGEKSEYVEISFKNKRKALFKNSNNLTLINYQYIIVEVDNGLDIGTVTAFGKCAKAKFKNAYNENEPTQSILRHPTIEDIEKYKKNSDDIINVLQKTRELVKKFNLDMKITDADWQLDRQRLTIYFIAPARVDFRELVKELARTFKTRIELRQISTREEAKRLGGMGSCGRPLCCSILSNDHCHVTLDHARTQQLSNNVSKLSGYCGRLKCCLLYEFETYVETLKNYPPLDSEIDFPEGRAKILKADIFKQQVFAYIPENCIYKSISFDEFKKLGDEGKIIKIQDDKYLKDIRRLLIDPDEADINDLKFLED